MRAVLAILGLLALGAAPAAAQFDPAYEVRSFSKTNERAAIHSTPDYKALLARVSMANATEAARIAAADPERSFVGQTACWSYGRSARATLACTTGRSRTTARSSPSCSGPATARP